MTNTLTIEMSRSNARFVHELRANQIKYKTPADDGFAVDATDLYAYLELTVEIIAAIAPIITAYINRNQSKCVKLRKHDGHEIEINGFSDDELIRILRETSLIKINDRDEQ